MGVDVPVSVAPGAPDELPLVRAVVQPGAKALRSEKAERKAHTQLAAAGSPVHSFQTLLEDLATLTKNTLQPKDGSAKPFEMITTPTPLQQRALDLLGVSHRLQAVPDQTPSGTYPRVRNLQLSPSGTSV